MRMDPESVLRSTDLLSPPTTFRTCNTIAPAQSSRLAGGMYATFRYTDCGVAYKVKRNMKTCQSLRPILAGCLSSSQGCKDKLAAEASERSAPTPFNR